MFVFNAFQFYLFMCCKCCDIVVIECNLVYMSWGFKKMVQLDLYPLYGGLEKWVTRGRNE
jgi:hypothetical protein